MGSKKQTQSPRRSLSILNHWALCPTLILFLKTFSFHCGWTVEWWVWQWDSITKGEGYSQHLLLREVILPLFCSLFLKWWGTQWTCDCQSLLIYEVSAILKQCGRSRAVLWSEGKHAPSGRWLNVGESFPEDRAKSQYLPFQSAASLCHYV